jgi:hypothetical protein
MLGYRELDLPECVENITQWGRSQRYFAGDVFQASCAMQRRFHPFVPCEKVIAWQSHPGDGQTFP